jgi:hypothetical protein
MQGTTTLPADGRAQRQCPSRLIVLRKGKSLRGGLTGKIKNINQSTSSEAHVKNDHLATERRLAVLGWFHLMAVDCNAN